jgi:hypothetical protein
MKAKRNLVTLRKGYFVGLIRTAIGPTNFVLFNAGVDTGDFKFLTRRNSGWSSRVMEVYRVDEFDLGTSWKPAEAMG